MLLLQGGSTREEDAGSAQQAVRGINGCALATTSCLLTASPLLVWVHGWLVVAG